MVDFGTLVGSAQAAADFRAVSGTLTFEPYEQKKTVAVELLGNP